MYRGGFCEDGGGEVEEEEQEEEEMMVKAWEDGEHWVGWGGVGIGFKVAGFWGAG